MPTIIFVTFALISALGSYLIIGHHHGRKAGAVGGGIALLFFSLLFLGVYALLRNGGLS